ncbi:MAG: hypothetical protein HC804_06900 [Anaerolineae bacterium]|nr:hypothetical protein [Anaerolineae bacterium]
MATYVKINDWVENEGEVADLDGDTFIVALSNTAPGSESTPPTGDGDGVLANVTQISYTNCSSRTLSLASSAQASGTYTIDFSNLVLTASGGTVGPFRYVYIYDDTPTSPADPLVCYFDYGSAITLASGETLTITFNASGLYTKA